MPGAVGAIVGSRRGQRSRPHPTPVSKAERVRREASYKRYERRVELKNVIRKYDTDSSETLGRSELVKLLTDINGSTPQGKEPTDEEVDFIMKVADAGGDDCINYNELDSALACWMTYVDHRQELEEKMDAYDSRKAGTLSRDDVKAYLTDLNGGIAVADEEVDMVMSEADVTGDGFIGRIELQRATAFWYGYVERKKTRACVVQ